MLLGLAFLGLGSEDRVTGLSFYLTPTSIEPIDLQKVIPLDKAMKTALDVQDGPVNKWKLEGDRGGAQYEFDIGTSNGEDREVQIDATSGEVKHDED